MSKTRAITAQTHGLSFPPSLAPNNMPQQQINPDNPRRHRWLIPKFQPAFFLHLATYITMFLQRVAGPSRLPYRAVETVSRRCNSTAPPTAAEPTGDELADRDSRTAFSREKAIWASNEGYKRWKSSSGNQYKAIPRGQKAAWLGGHVVCSHLAGFVEFALTM